MEKKMYCEPLANARLLVKFVNEESIKKEDIVTILNESGQLFLIYYK